MLRIDQVLGSRLDPAFAERIHEVEHQGAVDLLTVPAPMLLGIAFARRRKAAPRSRSPCRAISICSTVPCSCSSPTMPLVRVAQERWLRLQPRSIADAIELGYHAGNLYWRVRFAGEALLVAMEAPMDDYLARIDALIRDRRVISSLAEADEMLL